MLPLAGPSWCQCSQGYISNYVWPSRHGKRSGSGQARNSPAWASRPPRQQTAAAASLCCRAASCCVCQWVSVSVCTHIISERAQSWWFLVPCDLWRTKEEGQESAHAATQAWYHDVSYSLQATVTTSLPHRCYVDWLSGWRCPPGELNCPGSPASTIWTNIQTCCSQLACAQSKATLLTRSDGQLAQSSLTYPCPPTQFHLLASQYKAMELQPLNAGCFLVRSYQCIIPSKDVLNLGQKLPQ